MITFEYASYPAPADYQSFQDMLTQYGLTGWRFVVVYNGYMFFERRNKTKIG